MAQDLVHDGVCSTKTDSRTSDMFGHARRFRGLGAVALGDQRGSIYDVGDRLLQGLRTLGVAHFVNHVHLEKVATWGTYSTGLSFDCSANRLNLWVKWTPNPLNR